MQNAEEEGDSDEEDDGIGFEKGGAEEAEPEVKASYGMTRGMPGSKKPADNDDDDLDIDDI